MPVTKNTKTSKSGLLSRINLSTPKGRLIVTVLAFAIVGGGIVVYRSFAAVATWTYTAGTNTVIAGEVPTASPCKVTRIDIGDAKNPNAAFNLKCNAPGVADAATNNAAYILPKATPVDATMISKNFELCATARGKGDLRLNIIFANSKSGAHTSTNRTTSVNSSSFTTYCSYSLNPYYTNTDTFLQGRVSSGTSGGSVDVSNIIIREVPSYGSTGSTSSAPASSGSTSTPAPTK